MTRATDGRRMSVLLALMAAVTLVFAGLSGPPAGASGGNTATSAVSKKCKKKSYRKKHRKKCRKKKPAVPVVRATIRWETDPPGQPANLDLFVFFGNGTSGSPASNAIASSQFSANGLSAPGTETFTDLAPQLHRVFSFGVCYAAPDIGSVHAIGTIYYVTADGVNHTGSFDLGSKGGHAEFPVSNPSATYCT